MTIIYKKAFIAICDECLDVQIVEKKPDRTFGQLPPMCKKCAEKIKARVHRDIPMQRQPRLNRRNPEPPPF